MSVGKVASICEQGGREVAECCCCLKEELTMDEGIAIIEEFDQKLCMRWTELL